MESSIEDEVRADFARAGLVPGRRNLDAGELEVDIRAEVRRREAAQHGNPSATTTASGSGSPMGAMTPTSPSGSPTRSDAEPERDAEGYRRFGGMVGMGTALGRPEPTAVERAAARDAAAADEEDRLAELAAEATCPYCLDARSVLVTRDKDDPRFGQPIPCPECVTVEERMTIAGVPPQFVGVTVEAMELLPGKAHAIKQAVGWNGRDSVVIASRNQQGDATYGSGKTMLACVMARRAVQARRYVVFRETHSLMESLKVAIALEKERERGGGATGDSARVSRIMAPVLEAEVLVLDDLGAERGSPYDVERLQLIIRQRYERQRTTIITTNYASPRDFEQTLDGRVASRLSSYQWIAVGGEDLRHRERGR